MCIYIVACLFMISLLNVVLEQNDDIRHAASSSVKKRKASDNYSYLSDVQVRARVAWYKIKNIYI